MIQFDLPKKSLVEESGVRPGYDEFEKMATDMFDAFKLIHQTEKRKTRNAWIVNILLLLVMVIVSGYFTFKMSEINLNELIKSLEIL
jgi:hypothetical protein